MSECHSCGEEFSYLAQHWRQSNCPYPEITKRQREIITGVLMGDGWIDRTSRNPGFCVTMTNLPFLQWLSDELGDLVGEPSADETRNSKKGDSEKHVFEMMGKKHPGLGEFRDWYASGRKLFPESLTLTPLIASMWYCCDGRLGWSENSARPYVEIAAYKERERTAYITSLFREQGFEVRSINEMGCIRFLTDESMRLLQWMEGPPPGFEYKWCRESRSKYLQLKEEAYA